VDSANGTITRTFDGLDRLQIVDSANGTITRSFDGLDRLTQEQTAQGRVSYTFDAAGRRATMTVAGQAQVTYTWDNANRLTQIAHGSDVIGFAYDNADRRTSTTLANGIVMSYGYSDADELTSITYTKGATTLGDLQYAYDAAGRRSGVSGSFARTNLPAAVASATYNANNQLTSWAGTSLTYDLNGNMTGDGSKTYGWNARGELESISGASTASFLYDGVGRNRSKTIGSTQTGFLYDGLNFVQELSGTTVTANLLTEGLDEVFLRKGAANESFLADALGSVIALADEGGAVQTEYSFEPYGTSSKSGAATSNSQSYTAREDDGTGLMYYRARYYSPLFMRFALEDPIEFRGGDNYYTYVDGDPVSRRDPLGLSWGVFWGNMSRAFPGFGPPPAPPRPAICAIVLGDAIGGPMGFGFGLGFAAGGGMGTAYAVSHASGAIAGAIIAEAAWGGAMAGGAIGAAGGAVVGVGLALYINAVCPCPN
jgi:RHS repeat-associated protein